MNNLSPLIRIHYAVILMLWLLLAGCADTGGHVHGSVYMGTGYYDPWYWGPGYVVPPPDYIGPPPQRPDRPDHRPPKPSHPIAKPPPPRPMPMPRPTARPMMPRR